MWKIKENKVITVRISYINGAFLDLSTDSFSNYVKYDELRHVWTAQSVLKIAADLHETRWNDENIM